MNMGLEKIAQCLKLCTTLVDLNLVPNTHIRWLTTAWNPSLGESYASGLHGHPNSGTHTHTEINESSKYIENSKEKCAS